MVFTPKYRRGPFTDEILRRREKVMRDVCADFETELVEFNGDTDHVHLLVHYPPKVSLSRLVGSLKGMPARRLRQDYPKSHPKVSVGRSLLVSVLFCCLLWRTPLSVIDE